MMPNNVTFVNVILACANQADEKEGKHVHMRVIACNLEETVVIGTALVDLYGKCGCLKKSREVFEMMPYKNNVSWNAIIAAHAQHGSCIEAFAFFYQMQCTSPLYIIQE